MSVPEQIEQIEKNISNCYCPTILYAMNQKYRELKKNSYDTNKK